MKRSQPPAGSNKQSPSAGTPSNNKKLLDWNDVAQEVREFGSKGFEGKRKRSYEEEQYRQLTGRDKKKHQVPLPIVRGIRKKAAEREARMLQEARDSGMVLPKQKKREKNRKSQDSTSRVHGPAPSIGFMKRGVFRVAKPR
jgi:hypothetical protein